MSEEVLSRKKLIWLLVLYFGGYLFLYQDLAAQFIYDHAGFTAYMIVNTVIYALMIAVIILTNLRWYMNEWKKFRKKWLENSAMALETVCYLFVSNVLLVNFMTIVFKLTEAENQVNNDVYAKMDPFGFIISALIFAPFVEETVFRGCIFRPIREKFGFLAGAISAGVLFGVLHVIASVLAGNWLNTLHVFVYALCGFVLAYPYEKSGSIVTAMLAHSLYNLIGIVLMMI